MKPIAKLFSLVLLLVALWIGWNLVNLRAKWYSYGFPAGLVGLAYGCWVRQGEQNKKT